MITNTQQDWSIGSTVKVGFMKLVVDSIEQTKDGLPDIYKLSDPRNGRRYEFIPHVGLNRLGGGKYGL